MMMPSRVWPIATYIAMPGGSLRKPARTYLSAVSKRLRASLLKNDQPVLGSVSPSKSAKMASRLSTSVCGSGMQ
jgi:hypothetical protein